MLPMPVTMHGSRETPTQDQPTYQDLKHLLQHAEVLSLQADNADRMAYLQ